MKKLTLISIVALVLLTLGINNSMCASGSATEFIKNSNKKIQEGISGKSGAAAATSARAVVEDITDFSYIAAKVSENICKNLAKDQCQEFNTTFINLIKYSTSNKLSKIKSTQIDYNNETTKGDITTVQTTVSYEGKKIRINYQLHKVSGKWKIINYIVDDIDTIDNYKKQFARLFKKDSYEKIIKNMRTKVEKLKSGAGE